MPEYQNIFTQVQVQGTPEWGMDNENNMMADRAGAPRYSTLVGWIGNAQLGPIYLGTFGLVSLITGLAWFLIVGLSMLSQVDFSLPEMLRQLFWLALEPPSPEYGLTIPPLFDGGLYILASFFLLISVCSWWVRTYTLAEQHKMGKHVAWAFAGAIWLFLVLGLF
ncbi:MAG: photosynthetic reaction center subunit M, partial [Litoreibacter sp.]|nr:photosynthetic reaction center subunit M [Litoreibacter sp.]